MEGNHDLSLQIFRRINHNCNCEVSGSYMLQLASAALSIPNSSSPPLRLLKSQLHKSQVILTSTKSRVPSPMSHVQEARRPWWALVPAGCPSSLVSKGSYMLLHSGINLSVVLHRGSADRSGSNRILDRS